MRKLARFVRAVAVVGGMGLLAALAVTCVSVVGRMGRRGLQAVFGEEELPGWVGWVGPVLGEEELVQFAVGLALFAALPWLTLREGHVRVEVLRRFFGTRVNRGLEMVGHAALAGVAWLMMTRQWGLLVGRARRGQESFWELVWGGEWADAAARLRFADESQILGIKLLPLYAVAELCVALWFVVCVVCVWRSARAWGRGR